MSSVAYLKGGESATAGRMNDLFQCFDDKLAKIFSNKSFMLAWTDRWDDRGFVTSFNRIPRDLMGKGFFFVDGTKPSLYAYRAPDAIATSTVDFGLFYLRPYDHAPFTLAAGFAPKLFHDEALRIVTIDTIPAARYTNGLSSTAECTLFDHSLEAHKYTRASDGVVFWMKEKQVAQAEKRYRYAVAEIILEGQTSVTLQAGWDKYNCFRVHNLNHAPATVQFGSSYTLNLGPLECRTVRRDDPTTNYRLGFRYFFKFEGGDFRHLWFWPTTFSGANTISGAHPYPSNSMAANNLSNPMIVHDWIRQLNAEDPDTALDISQGLRGAWVNLDPHELCDVYPLNAGKFGNPSDANTIFGDLLHHKGKVLLVKMTGTPVAGVYPGVDPNEIDFRGYGTIYADFADLAITEVGGTLRFKKKTDPYIVVPWGTNLFKTGESNANSFSLEGAGDFHDVEKAVFDGQAVTLALNNPGPRVLLPKVRNTTGDSRTYHPIGGGSTTVTGPDLLSLADAGAGTPKTLTGVHAVTVRDLLDLSYFGDGTLGSQNTNATTFVAPALVLTPFGLALKVSERRDANVFPPISVAPSAFYPGGFKLTGSLNSGYFERKRLIKFRGHGWPHIEEGRKYAASFAARYGRHAINATAYVNPINGPDGVDFSLQKMRVSELDAKVLEVVPGNSTWLANVNKRSPFWQFNNDAPDAGLAAVADNHALMSDADWKAWLQLKQGFLVNNSIFLRPSRGITYPLLTEHYNGLAQMVNQCKTGKALDCFALRFYYNTAIGTLQSSQVDTKTQAWLFSKPVPVDCYDCWEGAATSLYQSLGIAVRLAGDFPADYAAVKNVKQVDRTIHIDLSSMSLSNVTGPTTEADGFIWYRADVALTVSLGTISYADAGTAGTAYSRQGTFGLNTDYNTLKWVRIADVKALVEGLGLPFVFANFFEPARLAVLKTPRGHVDGPFDSRGPITFAARRVQWGNSGAFITPTQGGDGFDISDPAAEIVAFEPAPTPADATWKLRVSEWDQGSSTPLTVWQRKSWNARSPRWVMQQCTVNFSSAYPPDGSPGHFWSFSNSSYGPEDDAATFPSSAPDRADMIQSSTANGPFVQIEWDPTNAGETDLFERYTRFVFKQQRTLAFQSLNSIDAPARTRVFMAEKQFWRPAIDWWRSYLAAMSGNAWFLLTDSVEGALVSATAQVAWSGSQANFLGGDNGAWESAVPVGGTYRGRVVEMVGGSVQFMDADPADADRAHGTEFALLQERVNAVDL